MSVASLQSCADVVYLVPSIAVGVKPGSCILPAAAVSIQSSQTIVLKNRKKVAAVRVRGSRLAINSCMADIGGVGRHRTISVEAPNQGRSPWHSTDCVVTSLPEPVLRLSMLSLHSVSVGSCHMMVRRVGRRVAVQNVEVSLTGTCSSNAESQKSTWDPFMDAADLQRVKEAQVKRRQTAVLRTWRCPRGRVDAKARASPWCGGSHESALKANDSDLSLTCLS
jgi:hypothetical protein